MQPWSPILQLRDFSSQGMRLHKGRITSASFGGSLLQQGMGMGPAWMWVSCSSTPVTLKALQCYWRCYEFLRQRSKTGGKELCQSGTVWKQGALGDQKCAFQTYHHSCCLPVGSMVMVNLPPKPDLIFLALNLFSAAAQPRFQLDPEQDPEDRRRTPVPFLLFSSSTHSTCIQPLKVGIPCVHVWPIYLLSSNKAVQVEPNQTEGMKS